MITDQTLSEIVKVENSPCAAGKISFDESTERQGFLGFTFSKMPIDALALGLPVHNGSPFAIARQLYHRLLARLIANKVFYRQWSLTVLCGLLSLIPLFTNSWRSIGLYPDLQIVLDLGGIIVLIATLPALLMSGCSPSTFAMEVEAIIRRCFLRDVPDNSPEDLKDPWRHGWITADGRPLSSEISEADARFKLPSSRALWWIPVILAVVFTISSLLCGNGLGFLISVVALVAKMLLDKSPCAERPMELEAAENVEATAFVAAGAKQWAVSAEAARVRQFTEAARTAAESENLFLTLGTSTGLLAARGDFFAPSCDLPIGLGASDARQHVLILGGTGSGKTSGILRPLCTQITVDKNAGLVILDGKGRLPQELAEKLKGVKLIDPAKTRISLIGRLEPEILVSTLAETLGGKTQDPFWINAPSALLRAAAVLAKAGGDESWTLTHISRMIVDDDFRGKFIKGLPESVETQPATREALIYFATEWPNLDKETKANIMISARTWLSTLAGHPDLLKWSSAKLSEEDYSLEEVLKGGRVGILLPAYRYGKAGPAATALLKASIYQGLKARADSKDPNVRPLFMVIDEAQDVATTDDVAMLSIGRSLGLSMIAATQGVEGIVSRLGRETTDAWLSIFSNLLVLQGGSPSTDDLVTRRLGVSWKPMVDSVEGWAVRSAIQAQAVSGVLAAAQTQPSLRPFVNESALGNSSTKGVISGIARWMTGKEPTKRPHSRIGPQPLIQTGEVATLLAEPDTALALLVRGRVPRRDIIRLKPIY